ncbi:hypothetical protein MUK42_19208 [Musa troglodytarum]|uniref:Uncharacterized protein n=1 Tax=Musa troglodytarum TaxID=320322 RepID=A0A9E7K1Q6_9LILI|nr:hypothetical protein MUK42_19208 [Musa troglodytarum]
MAKVSRNMVVLALCLLLLVVSSSGYTPDCNLHGNNCFDDCTRKGYWRFQCVGCFFCAPAQDDEYYRPV